MAGIILSNASDPTEWIFDEGGQVLVDENGQVLVDDSGVQGPAPIIVGGKPTVRDGFGGLQGFVRSLYETTAGATVQDLSTGVTLTGSTLAGSYSTIGFMWNGVYQTLTNVSASVVLTAPQLTSSTWYLCVQRNYGFSLVWLSTQPQNAQTLSLAQVTVTSSAVSAISLFIQTSFGAGLYVHESTVPASLIPTSNSDGSMPS